MDTTRTRISVLLDEVGYRSNYAAQTLASKKAGILHVLLAAPMFHGHGGVLLSALNAGSEAGYYASLSSAYHPDSALHTQVIPFDTNEVVILVDQDPGVKLTVEIGRRIPTCLLLSSKKNFKGISTAPVDSIRDSRLAAGHLLYQGVSDIVYIVGPRSWSDTVMWRQGFTRVCEEADVEGRVTESFSWDAHDGYNTMRPLSHLPQAPQCANDQLALGAVCLIHERGARIPEDVCIIDFDDVDGANCYTSPLTTTRQPFDRSGRTGVRLVCLLTEGGRAEDATIDPEPVVRTSSALQGPLYN